MIAKSTNKTINLISQASLNGTNITQVGPAGFVLGPGLSTGFTFTLDTNPLGSDIESADLIVPLTWQYVDEPSLEFKLDVAGFVSVVSVIVSPTVFTYNAYSGRRTQGTSLSPESRIEVYNTLCGFDIMHYVSRQCNGVPTAPWIQFTPALQNPVLDVGFNRTLAKQRGTQDYYVFDVDFTQVGLEGVEATTVAARLETCFTVEVFLVSLNTMLSNPITVTAVSVEDCRPGYFSISGTNDRGCSPCPLGTYSDTRGSRGCMRCPDAVPLTKSVGTASPLQCLARAGFVAMNGERFACAAGMKCEEDATTVEEVQLLPGYWRTRADSVQTWACPEPQFCVGGSTGRAEWTFGSQQGGGRRRELATTSSSQLGLNASSLCSTYSTGVFCEACIEGYTHRGEQRMCEKCSTASLSADQGQVAGIMVGFLAAFFVAIGLFIYSFHFEKLAKGFTGRAQRINVFFKSFTNDLGVKLKILISLLQVLSGMSISFRKFLPQPFFDQLGEMLSVLAFDLVKIVDFGCTLPRQDHYTGLLISTLVPLFLAALIGVSHVSFQKWLEKRNYLQFKHEAREIFSTVFFLLLFLVYPAVAVKILKTFSCQTFDPGTSFEFSTLAVDRTLVCNFPPTDEYLAFFIYAIILGVLYILGIPILFFVLLYRKRKYLNPPGVDLKLAYAMREMDRHVQAYRFLWRPYTPRFYALESMELLRKLAQGAVLIFTEQGSTTQVVSQLGVTVASVIFFQSYRPFASPGNNLLAIAAQWSIFSISFVVLLMSFREKQALVGCADREAAFNEEALDALLIMSVLFTPLLALLQISSAFAWLLWSETKRAVLECVFGKNYARERTKRLQKQVTRMLSDLGLEADVVSDYWRDNRQMREHFNRLTTYTLAVKDGGFSPVEVTLMNKILEHNGTIQDSYVRQLDRLEEDLRQRKLKMAEFSTEHSNLEDDIRESEVDRLHDQNMMDTWKELTAGNERLIVELGKDEHGARGYNTVLTGIAARLAPVAAAPQGDEEPGRVHPLASMLSKAALVFKASTTAVGTGLTAAASFVARDTTTAGGVTPAEWTCPKCTFVNNPEALSCVECGDEVAPWLRGSGNKAAPHPVAALFKSAAVAMGLGLGGRKEARAAVVEEAEGHATSVVQRRKRSTFAKQFSQDNPLLESSSRLPGPGGGGSPL